MKLNEIDNGEFITKKAGLFAGCLRAWEDNQKINPPCKIDVMGKIGQFDVRHLLYPGYYGTEHYFGLYDKTSEKFAMFLTTTVFGRSGRVLEVQMVGVDIPFRGQQLPVKLYSWLIKQNNTILVSSCSQSVGGRSIWERLAHVQGIYMFGYNMSTGKSFSIDQNDLFDEDIYKDEIENEIEYLKSTYDEISNNWNGENYGVEQAKADNLKKQILDLQSQSSDISYVRLVAIKKK